MIGFLTTLLFCLFWVLVAIAVKYRTWELLRPSFWFAILFSATISCGAVFVADDHIIMGYTRMDDLHSIATLRFIVIIVPLFILLFHYLTPKLSTEAKNISLRCSRLSIDSGDGMIRRNNILLYALLLFTLLVLSIYFLHVPLRETGLWALFFNPEHSSEIREQSLKLVESTVVRFSYSWYRLLVVPSIILLIWMKPKSFLRVFVMIFITAVFLLSASLTGERSSVVFIVFTLCVFYMLLYGVQKSLLFFVLLAITSIPFVSLLTIVRSGLVDSMNIEVVTTNLYAIVNRLFMDPFASGVSTNLYAQEFGLQGVANIRPVAMLFNVPFVDLPNKVGLFIYQDAPIKTVSHNTAFLFDLQASFGLYIGAIMGTALLCLLDLSLYCYRKVNGIFLVILFGLLLRCVLSLTTSSFTTSLNTHGLFWIILVSLSWTFFAHIHEKRINKEAS